MAVRVKFHSEMTLGNALVWFRNDLRICDNPALSAAVNHILTARKMGETRATIHGILTMSYYEHCQLHKWGLAKTDYYWRSARSLQNDLAKLGIMLKVNRIAKEWQSAEDYYRDLGRSLAEHCSQTESSTIFMNREYDGLSIERDKIVSQVLDASGIAHHSSHDQCAVEVGSVLNKSGLPYKVFTQFKNSWAAFLAEPGLKILPAPEAIADQPVTVQEFPSLKELGYGALFESDEWKSLDLDQVHQAFAAGEKAAHARLTEFLSSHVKNYQEDRNHNKESGVSRLSAPLAVGSISLKQCLRAAIDANRGSILNGSTGLVTWISELCWRDFYRHILWHFPHVGVGKAFKPEYEGLAWRGWHGGEEGPQVEEEFLKWKEGRTGVPVVDAAMRQILREGWMGNRVRMIVAMYLTKDLLIHWRRGEEHFMRHLIDYDYPSNNGGWQWSASTGTDSQPYFRIFNPLLQSEKFDPEGNYIRKYVSELASTPAPAIHEPHSRLPKAAFEKLSYPNPMVDHSAARDRALALFTAGKTAAKRSDDPPSPKKDGTARKSKKFK